MLARHAGSRFDHRLAGDAGAITPEEAAGYQLFKSLAASRVTRASTWVATCFSGTVSSIRWVLPIRSWCAFLACATWRPRPYFHDGSAPTLPEAVKAMGIAQLDRVLTDQQSAAIVAFLDTLTGNYRGRTVGPAAATPRATTAIP